jgi:hypothetical protein
VRRAIVHIGMPRTATSALQFFLARRRRALAEVGILYPELAPAAGAEPRGNHKALGEALDGRRPRRERAALFAALDEALATTTADTVILSYEGLCQIGWPRRPWRALGDAFASRGFAMEILLTVKPPSEYLNSTYAWRMQFLREGRPFAGYVEAVLAGRTPEARRLDYGRLARPWAHAAGGRLMAVPVRAAASADPFLGRVLVALGLGERVAPAGVGRRRRQPGVQVDEHGAGEVAGAVLVDEPGRAGQDAARGSEVHGVVGDLHARARIAVDPPRDAAAGDPVGRLGDAQRRGGVEQPRHQVALYVRQRVTGREATAHGRRGQLHAVQRDGVAAGGAHPEGVPVVVDDDAGRVGRHHRVGVALGSLLVHVRDGHVQIGRRGGHRAEDLAAVDAPARIGARGARGRPHEVLAGLADGGGQDDAVAGDDLQRGRERACAPLGAGRDRDLPAALHVEHRDEVHVHADRDRGVAASQAA